MKLGVRGFGAESCMLSVKVDVWVKEYSLTNGWK